jgi:glycerol-3-phosphate O-acyltransferase
MRGVFSSDWPALAGEVIDRVVAGVLAEGKRTPVGEVINETLYCERSRLRRHPDAPRAEIDGPFFERIGRALASVPRPEPPGLLRQVVAHYADEIEGHFDPHVYRFATGALPVGLSLLLHGLSPGRLAGMAVGLERLQDRLIVDGRVASLRALASIGTVVLAPTHVSNLDSLLVGEAIHLCGLPPFAYGAGLNLFSNRLVGFFMRNLGAFTVDRLKTDPLYRAVLKEYAACSIEHGRHSLYFPGGTRSRSGAVETSLKKGLLGASLAAFGRNAARGAPRPRVFVVPCTISYPIVLEASTLVEDYLEEAGRARYVIDDDEFSRPGRWLDFLRGLVELDARIHVTIGGALDPLGNEVDDEGRSLDPAGRTIDAVDYLREDGRVAPDAERDAEYTRTLAARLAAAYQRSSRPCATHVVAHAAFDLLRAGAHQPDLFRLLGRREPWAPIPRAALEQGVGRVAAELDRAAAEGRIRADHGAAGRTAPQVLDEALRTFATYHATPVLRGSSEIEVGDARLLFYYRNRLDGYGLCGASSLVGARGAS